MNEGTSVHDENHFQRPPKYRTNMMHEFSSHHKILVSNKHRRAFRVSDNNDDSKSWDSSAVGTRTDSSDDMKFFRRGSSEHVRW
ncbi:hypothetical protein EKO27_g10966 [Xylaria grammica]|uniref:Uncharacterized protein n=1 Tax=Xylaria grammica TaxID=363999 RepID=A0A439CPQ8_9PEZI|nr:hypothetical protein EKO27_g10966 [Xylaria grammica]GAW19556.1 hypothetical protein ANO14919_090440 [Xylariales sp. No.14919]